MSATGEQKDFLAVEFPSEGGSCVGDLFLPPAGGPAPGLVFCPGFSCPKEFLTEEATFFAANGYVCLVLDYRTFGSSPGEPRLLHYPLRQVEDVRNAISYLETRPEVETDRIGVWGTSFGGGIALYSGAVDRRARVVVSQVPVVDGRRWMKALRTSEGYLKLMDRVLEDRRRRFAGEEGERIPVTGLGIEGEWSAMPGDAAIVEIMKQTEAAIPTYKPDLALSSIERIVEYSPMAVIDRIAPRPLLMVACTGYDMIHPIEDFLEAYELAREPKEIALLPYDQLGLYAEPGKSTSLSVELDFLRRHLPAIDQKAG